MMQSDGYCFHICPEFFLTVLIVPSPLRLFAALTGCLCDPIWPRENQIPRHHTAGEKHRQSPQGCREISRHRPRLTIAS